MSDLNSKLSDSLLEELRCYSCNGYLSTSPIRALPNGCCICGKCAPVDKNTPVYRVFPLEAILANVAFPCVNRASGCRALIHFNHTIDHESRCVYYTSTCPFTDSNCAWEGSGAEISEHFMKNHNYLLQGSAQFTIVSNENSEGTFLSNLENLYIVKYEYDYRQKMLSYDVRYCKQEQFNDLYYIIQILNSNHPDCTMYLKATKCCLYNPTFFAKDRIIQLSINQFYHYLDEPKNITFLIHFRYGNGIEVNTANLHLISNLLETLTNTLDMFVAKLVLFYREHIVRHSKEINDVIKTVFYLAVTQFFVSSITGGSKTAAKRVRNSY